MYAKVIDEPNLVRDNNGVIHNINEDDFHKFITQRHLKEQEINRIDSLEKEVSDIKNSLNFIIRLLQDDNK